MPEGARAAAQQQRARRWWTTSDADDPITLEPIASLDVAPFDLHGALFDARELARYMLTSGVLENPLTRAPLTRAEALALDAHRLRWRLLDDDPTGVATLLDALRLFADSTAQQQRVAATTLAALFNLERRAERSRHAPGAAPGAIDDDAAGASDDEESYPALPSHAAVHPPRPPLLDGHARLFAGAEEARETARIFAESEALRLRAARTRERAERRRVEVAELRREAEAARVEVEAAAVKAAAEAQRRGAADSREAAVWDAQTAETLKAECALRSAQAAAAAIEAALKTDADLSAAAAETAAAETAAKADESRRLATAARKKKEKRDKAKLRDREAKAKLLGAAEKQAAIDAAAQRVENAKHKCAQCGVGLPGSLTDYFCAFDRHFCSTTCVKFARCHPSPVH